MWNFADGQEEKKKWLNHEKTFHNLLWTVECFLCAFVVEMFFPLLTPLSPWVICNHMTAAVAEPHASKSGKKQLVPPIVVTVQSKRRITATDMHIEEFVNLGYCWHLAIYDPFLNLAGKANTVRITTQSRVT